LPRRGSVKNFFVFYNSQFDPVLQARTYADEARVHAKNINKTVIVTLTDVKAPGADLTYYVPDSTIQCVPVDSGSVKDRQINPPDLTIIDGMIDAL
jgi:hypothetical protein